MENKRENRIWVVVYSCCCVLADVDDMDEVASVASTAAAAASS